MGLAMSRSSVTPPTVAPWRLLSGVTSKVSLSESVAIAAGIFMSFQPSWRVDKSMVPARGEVFSTARLRDTGG